MGNGEGNTMKIQEKKKNSRTATLLTVCRQNLTEHSTARDILSKYPMWLTTELWGKMNTAIEWNDIGGIDSKNKSLFHLIRQTPQ